MDEIFQHRSIRFHAEIFQCGIIIHKHIVRAVDQCLFRKGGNIFARHHTIYGFVDDLCQFPCFAQQFKGDWMNIAVVDLRHHADPFPGGLIQFCSQICFFHKFKNTVTAFHAQTAH